MQYPRLSVSQLREHLGERFGKAIQFAPTPRWALPGGCETLVRGSLVELQGAGAHEWLFRVFKDHIETRVAWVEHELTLFPPAVQQRGVGLDRFLFLECGGRNASHTLQTLFRSQLFHFIVTSSDLIPAVKAEVFLRKIQLQCQQAGAVLFFLTQREIPFFGMSYRIRISSDGTSAEFLKRKRS